MVPRIVVLQPRWRGLHASSDREPSHALRAQGGNGTAEPERPPVGSATRTKFFARTNPATRTGVLLPNEPGKRKTVRAQRFARRLQPRRPSAQPPCSTGVIRLS